MTSSPFFPRLFLKLSYIWRIPSHLKYSDCETVTPLTPNCALGVAMSASSYLQCTPKVPFSYSCKRASIGKGHSRTRLRTRSRYDCQPRGMGDGCGSQHRAMTNRGKRFTTGRFLRMKARACRPSRSGRAIRAGCHSDRRNKALFR